MRKTSPSSGSKAAPQTKLNSIIEEPFKLFFLLVPIVILLGLGCFTMGVSDTMYTMTWALTLVLFGFATLPLSSFLFKNSRSGGFFLSQTLGLLSVCIVVWTLTHIGIFRFHRAFIIIAIIGITAACYLTKPLRESLVDALGRPGVIENMAVEETIFVIAFVLMTYFKGFRPDISGQEKFMDYGFIMSMIRSTRLPANDMWLSGHSINYYYFGQYIYALVIKLCGIKPAIGYTIAMASAAAIPFTTCYCVGVSLIDLTEKCGAKVGRFTANVCGILAGFTVIVFGNSHSFYYDEESVIGNNILKWFGKQGINVGRTDRFFYPDSTRFIGYNPETLGVEGYANGGDATIEEFPQYAYLLGDLHAHYVSTMIVVFMIALSISMLWFVVEKGHVIRGRTSAVGIDNFDLKTGIFATEYRNIISPCFIAVSVALGIAQMTNYWDFLIYFIFLSMTMLLVNMRRTSDFARIYGIITLITAMGLILGVYLVAGDRPLLHVLLQLVVLILVYGMNVFAPDALSRTAVSMSFMFTVSNIIALSFNLSFDMISNKLGLCVNHSPLFQLFILYGTHFIIVMTFMVFTIINKNYRKAGTGKHSARSSSESIMDLPSEGFRDPVSRFLGERNFADVFVCGMTVVGLLLLAAPEIFYVRDIYTSGYLRSNTMFKFSYAAFIILSICVAYAVIRMIWIINKQGKYSTPSFVLAVVFCILLLIPAHYTVRSLKQRSGDLKRENYKTLDGTQYLYTHSSPECVINETGNLIPYLNAIEWFNSTVEGSPVIIEYYGTSYTDHDIVSAYTGLPTVFGWQTHEWLWRYHGIVDPESNLLVSDPEHDVWEIYITPRHNDINRFYTTNDPAELQTLIDRYNIEYVVLGDMERMSAGVDNSAVIDVVGDVVFESGSLRVWHVTPTAVS